MGSAPCYATPSGVRALDRDPLGAKSCGRCGATSFSPAGPTIPCCPVCRTALLGQGEVAVLLCTTCGQGYEVTADGLASLWPLRASVTTELAVAGAVTYLAVWRLETSVSPGRGASAGPATESLWEKVVRAASPGPAYLYVPAFSERRYVVQRLGSSLTRIQPVLELTRGVSTASAWEPALLIRTITLVGARADEHSQEQQEEGETPDLGLLSPVVLGRQAARTLAHYVYQAVDSPEARELRPVDYELVVAAEDLVFLPAVWDPRYVHEANWRLLLREFDGLVA